MTQKKTKKTTDEGDALNLANVDEYLEDMRRDRVNEWWRQTGIFMISRADRERLYKEFAEEKAVNDGR